MTKNAIKVSRIYLAKAEINFRLISKAHTKRKTIREKKKIGWFKTGYFGLVHLSAQLNLNQKT